MNLNRVLIWIVLFDLSRVLIWSVFEAARASTRTYLISWVYWSGFAWFSSKILEYTYVNRQTILFTYVWRHPYLPPILAFYPLTLTGKKAFLLVNLPRAVLWKMRTICAHFCKKMRAISKKRLQKRTLLQKMRTISKKRLQKRHLPRAVKLDSSLVYTEKSLSSPPPPWSKSNPPHLTSWVY